MTDLPEIDVKQADLFCGDDLGQAARFALHQAVLRLLHTAMDVSNLASVCGRPKLAAIVDAQIEPFGGYVAQALKGGKMGDEFTG